MNKLLQEFLEGISIPEPNSGCMLWEGYVNEKGYGKIQRNGKQWRAHRLVYHMAHGSLADDDVVYHSCDVPSCVNPAHLFIGSQADNLADMHRKGRHYSQSVALRDFCGRGHLRTEDNTYTYRNKRLCRACQKEDNDRWYAKNRDSRYWIK